MGLVRQFGDMGKMAMASAPQTGDDPRRVNPKVTDQQVIDTLWLREIREWSALRISRKLGITQDQAQGIINGNGTRTVALRQRST